MFQKKCQTCQLYVSQNKACQIMIPQMQGKIEPDDYCSQHNDHVQVCEICGGGLLESFIEVDADGKVHIYCARCVSISRQ